MAREQYMYIAMSAWVEITPPPGVVLEHADIKSLEDAIKAADKVRLLHQMPLTEKQFRRWIRDRVQPLLKEVRRKQEKALDRDLPEDVYSVKLYELVDCQGRLLAEITESDFSFYPY